MKTSKNRGTYYSPFTMWLQIPLLYDTLQPIKTDAIRQNKTENFPSSVLSPVSLFFFSFLPVESLLLFLVYIVAIPRQTEVLLTTKLN